MAFSRGGTYTLDIGFWPSSASQTFIPVSTPLGTNVTVHLGGITINFGRVTAPGMTSITPTDQCIPTEFTVFNNLAFDISTTATVTGPITVSFDLSRLQPIDPCIPGQPCRSALVSTLRVFHGENGVLVDRTAAANPLLPSDPHVVAIVNSLSPFTIAEQPPQAALQFTLGDLRALRQTVSDEHDAHALDDAIHDLTRALDPSLWLDPLHVPLHGGEPVFEETKNAVKKLNDLMSEGGNTIPAATVRFYIDRIIRVDRRLASIAISDAQAAGRDQETLTRATNKLNEGDANVAAGKFAEAIEDYAQVWQLAVLVPLKLTQPKSSFTILPKVGGCGFTTNGCPPDKPYTHCNAFGDCFCSAYP